MYPLMKCADDLAMNGFIHNVDDKKCNRQLQSSLSYCDDKVGKLPASNIE